MSIQAGILNQRKPEPAKPATQSKVHPLFDNVLIWPDKAGGQDGIGYRSARGGQGKTLSRRGRGGRTGKVLRFWHINLHHGSDRRHRLQKYAGSELEINGERLIVFPECNLLAVMK